MSKNISIIGSTGSIGTQALDVVKHVGGLNVLALTANSSVDLLERQYYEFKPRLVAVMDERAALELKHRLAGQAVTVLAGMDGVVAAATIDGADLVLNSVVGNIGLIPTLEAVKAGKNIAIANKETLVTAGAIVMEEVRKNNVALLPVDSEHTALFQCREGNMNRNIRRIFVTASGGPFRGKKRADLQNVAVADALAHPNWSMGRKITIDSATLMNKGLEVIEAKWLLGLSPEQIDVLVHPQSIVHSMIEYEDGSVLAQLSENDMRLPIQFALAYPERVKNDFPKMDFMKHSALTFEPPDMETFRCLGLAYEALRAGGLIPTVMNAANEIAVNAFLSGGLTFLGIPALIEKTVCAYNSNEPLSLESILEADRWAREFAKKEVDACQF